ncbi:uncharacterized protein LOC135153448 [Lytechinus pictus]|uniref:uncharacterized protein LOC135153448 n=1 Tax=Lytechinus pictus TaxID=7653 RepID=UPI0030BA0629
MNITCILIEVDKISSTSKDYGISTCSTLCVHVLYGIGCYTVSASTIGLLRWGYIDKRGISRQNCQSCNDFEQDPESPRCGYCGWLHVADSDFGFVSGCTHQGSANALTALRCTDDSPCSMDQEVRPNAGLQLTAMSSKFDDSVVLDLFQDDFIPPPSFDLSMCDDEFNSALHGYAPEILYEVLPQFDPLVASEEEFNTTIQCLGPQV